MKTVIGFLTLALLNTAYAAPKIATGLPDVESILRKVANPKLMATMALSNPPATPPTRTAKAKVRILKAVYTQVGTSIDLKVEEVCETTGNVDVYDHPTQSGTITPPQKTASCPSTVEGKAVDVDVYGIVVIGQGALFVSEPPADLKSFSASVVTNSPSAAGPKFQFNFAQSLTRDLTAKSSILPIGPNQVVNCSTDSAGNSSCTVALPEAFFGIVEIMD